MKITEDDGMLSLANEANETASISFPLSNNISNQNVVGHFYPTGSVRNLQQGLILDLEHYSTEKMTIFSVFKPTYPHEQIIWSLEDEDHIMTLQTSHRTANVSKGKYLNYDNQFRGNRPQLQGYIHNQRNTSINKLRIGSKFLNQELPIQNFRGSINELMIFERILGRKERQKVESYLALKYGIPIDQGIPTDYINSKGSVIWDAEINSKFQFRQAGIGRDDYFQLNQKQSKSSYDSNLLVIGLGDIKKYNRDNSSIIENNNFLIWSDNDGNLELEEADLGLYRILSRRWAMNKHGNQSDLQSNLLFDLERVENFEDRDLKYWLLIDKSGSSDFDIENIDVLQAEEHSRYYNAARFEGVEWDTDKSGRVIFTFVESSDFLPLVDVIQPNCQLNSAGQIQLKIRGGQPPYKCVLKGEDNFKTQFSGVSYEHVEFDQLPSGDYTLTINDSNGLSFSKSFFLQNSDAIQAKLKNKYSLREGEYLVLKGSTSKLSESNELSYTWSNDSGWTEYSSEVKINSTGNYSLTIDNEGCKSKHHFKVVPEQVEGFERVELYPNPVSTNEEFTLKIKMSEVRNLRIVISDLKGEVVQSSYLEDKDYYLYSNRITQAGAYVITLDNGIGISSHTLIIH